EQERTQKELQTRTQERDEARQEVQELKGNLETSQLKENKLNEQIIQLQSELFTVHQKLKEVETDRNDNRHSILNHHQEKISKLEQEKEELLKKHQELNTLYEETKQQLERLNGELREAQSLGDSHEKKFIAACKKLEEERNKNNELEQKLKEQTSDFTTQISNLQKLSEKEKAQLIQQITILSSEKLTNEQQLTEKIAELENRIKNLENTSQMEKKNLENALNDLKNKLQEKLIAETTYQTQIQELDLKINDLEQEIQNSTSLSDEVKQQLINELAATKQKLNERNDLVEDLENKRKELNNRIASLMAEINSLQQTSQAEKNALNQQIENLKNAKLINENELQEKINNLSKTSDEEKKKLEEQVLDLKTKLKEKVQAEQGYQTKISELEDNLANTTKSLTDKLNIALQEQTKEKSLANKLEQEVKTKEQDLKNLHQKLVDLQKQLNTANDTINQQNQRISGKNQQLADLVNQLTDKDKLITNLLTKISELEKPPTFQTDTDTDNEKTDELQGQTREGDKTVGEKSNSEDNKTGEKSAAIYSQEDLEKLIKEHQQEVQKLKALIAKSQEVETVQETPVKEAIQQLPKKNNTEIREINNQIPTYEEFLKNYRANQEVNDSYENEIESYRNIEAPLTYGPMPRTRNSASIGERRLPNYYNFFCKCEAKFNSFSEFLNHIQDSHEIRNFNFPQILGQRNGINNRQIELVKKYRLQCRKCQSYAAFDREELLNQYLEERVKQKLIYSYYKRKFEQYTSERDGEKELRGHKEELCEKCKSLDKVLVEHLLSARMGRFDPSRRLKNNNKKVLAEKLKVELNSPEYVAMPDLISGGRDQIRQSQLEQNDWKEIINLIEKRNQEREQNWQTKRKKIEKKLNNMRGYCCFLGGQGNGLNYHLYIAESHPILDSFSFQPGFYLINDNKPVEKNIGSYEGGFACYGGETNPGNWQKYIEVGDQITITPYEVENNSGYDDNFYIIKRYHGKANVGSPAIWACLDCYPTKKAEYLQNYAGIYERFKEENGDIDYRLIKAERIDCYANKKDQNGQILKQQDYNREFQNVENYLLQNNKKTLNLEEVKELLNNSKSPSNSTPTSSKKDYTPYLIGGTVGLGLVALIVFEINNKEFLKELQTRIQNNQISYQEAAQDAERWQEAQEWEIAQMTDWVKQENELISNNRQNEYSPLIIAIPITSDLAKIYPFEIVIELGSGKAKVLTDQVRSIDKARLGDKIGQVGETKMTEISEKMKRAPADLDNFLKENASPRTLDIAKPGKYSKVRDCSHEKDTDSLQFLKKLRRQQTANINQLLDKHNISTAEFAKSSNNYQKLLNDFSKNKPNKTPKEKQDLAKKKKELEELEKPKNNPPPFSSSSPIPSKNNNFLLYIGLGIIGLLVIVFLVVISKKRKRA
ncbi:45329_t:CDS:10, partial [Gigaspora margarita]